MAVSKGLTEMTHAYNHKDPLKDLCQKESAVSFLWLLRGLFI